MRKPAIALVLAAASIAALLATPADAKQRHQAVPRDQFNQLQLPGSAISPADDPTGVYRNGRLIGRDPDPNIRMQLRDDDLWLRRF